MEVKYGIEVLKEVKAIVPRLRGSLYFSMDRGRVECLVTPTEEEFDFVKDVMLGNRVYKDYESKLVVD